VTSPSAATIRAEEIRRLRAAGYSYAELGRKYGISERRVREIAIRLPDQRPVRQAEAQRLAKALVARFGSTFDAARALKPYHFQHVQLQMWLHGRGAHASSLERLRTAAQELLA
jgi:transcriptional regulator with XRE-family HTH domain